MSDLQACPFCGSEPRHNSTHAWCHGSEGNRHDLVSLPIHAWNHRALPPALAVAVKPLEWMDHKAPPRGKLPSVWYSDHNYRVERTTMYSAYRGTILLGHYDTLGEAVGRVNDHFMAWVRTLIDEVETSVPPPADAIVGHAARDALEDIRGDTGHHPPGAEHPERRKLQFSPRHWAASVAMYLRSALVEPAPAVPVPEGWKLVPLDDPSRPLSDPLLPATMVEAGIEALDRVDHDLRSDDPDAVNWGTGTIAVAVFRAMCAAAPEPPATRSYEEGKREGVDLAAKFVHQRLTDYVNEYGSYDPSTGIIEFPGTGEEYVGELENIEVAIRTLKDPHDDHERDNP